MTISIKVHCPGCTKPLRVPRASSGRRARCPNCQKIFVVPKPSDLVEETISTWIEEDVDKLEKEQEKQWENIASLKAYQRSESREKLSVGKRKPGQAPTPPGYNPLPAPSSKQASAAEASLEAAASGSTILAVEEVIAITGGVPPSRGARDPVAEAPGAPAAPPAPAIAEAPASAKPAAPSAAPMPVAAAASFVPHARGGADVKDAAYPNNLRVDPMQPHLVVSHCDQSGVEFAFDSVHLEHEGFRTSFPIRCAFSGETERRKLFGRPMAFIDRSGARIRSPQEIDAKHTSVILPQQTPYDLLGVMGQLADLPKPFCYSVPYYAGPEHSHVSLKCVTRTREDTGITCFVTVPDGPAALQWLANVNGTCGVEYLMLAREVTLMQNDAWKQLSDEVRRRVNVWCPFEPQERFQMYLTDGDFGSRDRGLAGLVITDRRMFYCKNFHRGTLNLSETSTIIIRDEKDFAHLAVENSGGRTKLCKLYQTDIPTLLEFLSPWSNLTIDRKAMAAS